MMFEQEIISQLDDKDLIGQLLCYDIYDGDDPAEVEKVLSEIRPGGLYLFRTSKEKIQMYKDMANKYTKIPVVIVSDVEYGPGEDFPDMPVLPNVMAWGACDEPALIEETAEVMAKICRLHGIVWTLSPVVDINMNFSNPLVNTRAASDSHKQVLKIMGAYLRGIQKNGYMVASLKHFPGDGVDDRNQHFCTTVNSLDMDQWNATYGNVYREMIKQGAASVMCAHIALPAYANEEDELGPIPCVLSKPLMTDLLKGELKFGGAVISDAMSMVGSSSRVDLDKLALTFIQSGGDMVLFNEPDDHRLLQEALQNGTLSRERLVDAVTRIIKVKKQARLFEREEDIIREIGESEEALCARLEELSAQIAEKSIKIVRDFKETLPIKPKSGARFLSLEVKEDPNLDTSFISEELKKRGYVVDVFNKIGHKELSNIMYNYDYLLINYFIRGLHGGTLRIGWDHVMTFWRAYALKHPNVIFTSFGDPYKLYDYPFLKTYINTFSYSKSSMEAYVKVLLGEVQSQAKNPVSLKGFFERETE